MKKTVSIIIAFILTITMVSSMSACGKQNDDGKMVELVISMGGSEQKDSKIVLAEINKKLENLLPNTKINFLYGDLSSKWSLWMAGKTVIDIGHSGFSTDLQNEIDMGSYLPLNDLIKENAPTLYKEQTGIFKDLYGTGSLDGELYAVPIPQIYVKESLSVTIPEDLKSYMDYAKLIELTYANPHSTEEMYQVLDKFLQNAKASGKAGTDLISMLINPDNLIMFAQRGYEFIGGTDTSVCYDLYSDKVEIIDFHQTPEYQNHIKWMNKWYNDGFISSDILSGGGAGKKLYLIECHNTDRLNESADHTKVEKERYTELNRTYILVTNPETYKKGSYTLGSLHSYLSIPFTSQNPVRAIKLLDLLYSEKGSEIINLLTYGIEGTHYEKIDDNVVKPFDYVGQPDTQSRYGIPNWKTGNMFNQYINYPYDNTVKEYAEKYYENTLPNYGKAKTYGLSFNSKNIATYLSQMYLVNQEYETQLNCGVITDYKVTFDTMNTKMAAAGMDKIIKEYQSQYEEFSKSKK